MDQSQRIGFFIVHVPSLNSKRGRLWEWMASLLLVRKYIVGVNFYMVEWNGDQCRRRGYVISSSDK